MKLQTPVADDKCRVGISYNDKIMMLGSCFTDNIGKQLLNYGFDVCVNPFGTLYNPASIYESVLRLIQGTPFTEEDCTQIGAGSERICSFHHHTTFARETRQEFLNNANQALNKASEFFKECNKVIITLGTSWCYRHLSTDRIVCNCLKHPAAEFVREFLPSDQTAAILSSIISACKDKEFIFTVSPIRHFKDGAHGNQLSKSALLLGADSAIRANEKCADYFPAYEIVMDELRDYRFYAEDMCHPSAQAVDYIRERFLNWALPAEQHATLEANIKKFKQSCHRALSTL
ncbi:MAG: GSCFA domain-containing protein [Bacteroidales bacterium]|nr:GSCFA domain-containing protein [Bacteroidales bacterium]